MNAQPPYDGQWLCKPCHVLFSSWEAIKEHKAAERINSGGKSHIHCKFCYQDFDSQEAEFTHLQKEHAQSQHLKCPGCGQGPFQRVSGLMAHIEKGDCHRIDNAMVDELRNRKLEFPRRIEQATKQPLKNNFARYMPYFKEETMAGSFWDEAVEVESSTPRVRLTEEQFPELSSATTKKAAVAPVAAKPRPNNQHLNVSHDGATSGVKVQQLWSDPHNPDCPSFNVSRYHCSISEKYNCPRPLCMKCFKNARGLINHLKTAHNDKKFTCPGCFKIFNTLVAITQHAESSSNRCHIRNSDNYHAYMDQLTAGIVAVQDDRHEDGTVAYKTSDKAKEMYGGNLQPGETDGAAFRAVQPERPIKW